MHSQDKPSFLQTHWPTNSETEASQLFSFNTVTPSSAFGPEVAVLIGTKQTWARVWGEQDLALGKVGDRYTLILYESAFLSISHMGT